MFENIGGKIKKVSQIVCYAGIGISVLFGLITIIEGGILPGLLIVALGSIASWLGAIMSYGFGQLVENSDILASEKTLEVNNTKNNAKNNKKINTLKMWKEEGIISEEEYNKKLEELQQ